MWRHESTKSQSVYSYPGDHRGSPLPPDLPGLSTGAAHTAGGGGWSDGSPLLGFNLPGTFSSGLLTVQAARGCLRRQGLRSTPAPHCRPAGEARRVLILSAGNSLLSLPQPFIGGYPARVPLRFPLCTFVQRLKAHPHPLCLCKASFRRRTHFALSVGPGTR